jgi:formylglycine-generating enzyme required for sulfatase activity
MALRVPMSALIVAAALLGERTPAAVNLQSAGSSPLTYEEVESALKVLSPRRIAMLIRERGTTFILSAEGDRRLRMAAGAEGVDAGLLDEIVRLLAPPRQATVGMDWTAPTDGRTMVWIPPGAFQMGSPQGESGREPDEAPHAAAITTGFWLDAHEVTYRAFQKFVLANPEWQKTQIDDRWHDGNYLADWKGNTFPPGRADAPVVNVSWHAARAYAAWAGKRLPAEAEWEYAGRGGTRSAYWWGDAFESGPFSGTTKHPWGLTAMLGGVWEWTSSLYRTYPYVSNDGRNDASATGARVIRGGAGTSGPAILRSANRNSGDAERSSDILGFRCAL